MESKYNAGTPRQVCVHRALAAACRRSGYRMLHVADEPERCGAGLDGR